MTVFSTLTNLNSVIFWGVENIPQKCWTPFKYSRVGTSCRTKIQNANATCSRVGERALLSARFLSSLVVLCVVAEYVTGFLIQADVLSVCQYFNSITITIHNYNDTFLICLNSESIYFWQQTSENITVHVRMPEGVTKEEVNFTLTPTHISIGVCGGSPLVILEGQLYADVQPETSAWILTSDKRSELLFFY